MAYQKILLSIFFLMCASVLSNNTDHEISHQEVAYLLKVREALHNLPSTWSDNISICQWTGVVCASFEKSNLHYVESLDLRSRELKGTLPLGIEKSLIRLRSIILINNSLSGPLPFLSGLWILQTVALSSNNFSSIPSGYFQGLPNLQYIDLGYNTNLPPWTFPTELKSYSNLVAIEFPATNLMGSLPDIFDLLSVLVGIYLAENNLTGVLPESLSKLSKLAILDVKDNNLSGTIEVISSMPLLQNASFEGNSFEGSIPDLSRCPGLTILFLANNRLTGVVPRFVYNSYLVRVTLQNNWLQGPLPSSYNMTQLVELNVTGNAFCLDHPGPCDHRVTILLEVARTFYYPLPLAQSWRGNDPCQSWNFITCDDKGKIRIMNFTKMNLSGTISPSIENLTDLYELHLGGNRLNGSIPKGLTNLRQLKILDVTNNNLSGNLPPFSTKTILITTGNDFLQQSHTPKSSHPSTSILVKHKSSTKKTLIIAVTVGAAGAIILGACAYLAIWHTRKRRENKKQVRVHDQELACLDFKVVATATNNFHLSNTLGKGGFGQVYKGILSDGQEIAVKRLSKASRQGDEEFMNEVTVISKLQHRNLVRLVGCCIHRDEKILVYEFMPNKSLDAFIFDPVQRKLLNWTKRFSIIEGIARGILYLHRDSRLRIIHRDLKASNILLDAEMNPKISDFGLAKIYKGKDEDITERIAGTRGYMAPEYAIDGLFSEKSDVYSFGILLLEIVSGKRNTSFYNHEDFPTLVAFAWNLWNEGDIRSLIDPEIPGLDSGSEKHILKYIHIAFLCIQEVAEERPPMTSVVSMLTTDETFHLPPPKQIAFQPEHPKENASKENQCNSNNNVSVTELSAR